MEVNGFFLGVRAEADTAIFPDPEKYHLIKVTGPVVLVILSRLFYMMKTTTPKQQTVSFSAAETRCCWKI